MKHGLANTIESVLLSQLPVNRLYCRKSSWADPVAQFVKNHLTRSNSETCIIANEKNRGFHYFQPIYDHFAKQHPINRYYEHVFARNKQETSFFQSEICEIVSEHPEFFGANGIENSIYKFSQVISDGISEQIHLSENSIHIVLSAPPLMDPGLLSCLQNLIISSLNEQKVVWWIIDSGDTHDSRTAYIDLLLEHERIRDKLESITIEENQGPFDGKMTSYSPAFTTDDIKRCIIFHDPSLIGLITRREVKSCNFSLFYALQNFDLIDRHLQAAILRIPKKTIADRSIHLLCEQLKNSPEALPEDELKEIIAHIIEMNVIDEHSIRCFMECIVALSYKRKKCYYANEALKLLQKFPRPGCRRRELLTILASVAKYSLPYSLHKNDPKKPQHLQKFVELIDLQILEFFHEVDEDHASLMELFSLAYFYYASNIKLDEQSSFHDIFYSKWIPRLYVCASPEKICLVELNLSVHYFLRKDYSKAESLVKDAFHLSEKLNLSSLSAASIRLNEIQICGGVIEPTSYSSLNNSQIRPYNNYESVCLQQLRWIHESFHTLSIAKPNVMIQSYENIVDFIEKKSVQNCDSSLYQFLQIGLMLKNREASDTRYILSMIHKIRVCHRMDLCSQADFLLMLLEKSINNEKISLNAKSLIDSTDISDPYNIFRLFGIAQVLPFIPNLDLQSELKAFFFRFILETSQIHWRDSEEKIRFLRSDLAKPLLTNLPSPDQGTEIFVKQNFLSSRLGIQTHKDLGTSILLVFFGWFPINRATVTVRTGLEETTYISTFEFIHKNGERQVVFQHKKSNRHRMRNQFHTNINSRWSCYCQDNFITIGSKDANLTFTFHYDDSYYKHLNRMLKTVKSDPIFSEFLDKYETLKMKEEINQLAATHEEYIAHHTHDMQHLSKLLHQNKQLIELKSRKSDTILEYMNIDILIFDNNLILNQKLSRYKKNSQIKSLGLNFLELLKLFENHSLPETKSLNDVTDINCSTLPRYFHLDDLDFSCDWTFIEQENQTRKHLVVFIRDMTDHNNSISSMMIQSLRSELIKLKFTEGVQVIESHYKRLQEILEGQEKHSDSLSSYANSDQSLGLPLFRQVFGSTRDEITDSLVSKKAFLFDYVKVANEILSFDNKCNEFVSTQKLMESHERPAKQENIEDARVQGFTNLVTWHSLIPENWLNDKTLLLATKIILNIHRYQTSFGGEGNRFLEFHSDKEGKQLSLSYSLSNNKSLTPFSENPNRGKTCEFSIHHASWDLLKAQDLPSDFFLDAERLKTLSQLPSSPHIRVLLDDGNQSPGVVYSIHLIFSFTKDNKKVFRNAS
ncbi:MAG: hypothetical protein HRU19_25795 [Pseudobacteriovorax sp.]|nr:hypothetical protein [Pseudobacteriovorax sp.]